MWCRITKNQRTHRYTLATVAKRPGVATPNPACIQPATFNAVTVCRSGPHLSQIPDGSKWLPARGPQGGKRRNPDGCQLKGGRSEGTTQRVQRQLYVNMRVITQTARINFEKLVRGHPAQGTHALPLSKTKYGRVASRVAESV